MIILTFGIFIGLGIALIFPESLVALRKKILKLIHHENCDK